MLGPVLSSFFYAYFNYSGTFFFFSGLILVIGLISMSFVPNNVNHDEGEQDKTEYVTFGAFAKRKYAVLCLTTLFFACIFFFYLDPILAVVLHDKHGLSIPATGFSFATIAFTFSIGAPLFGNLS